MQYLVILQSNGKMSNNPLEFKSENISSLPNFWKVLFLSEPSIRKIKVLRRKNEMLVFVLQFKNGKLKKKYNTLTKKPSRQTKKLVKSLHKSKLPLYVTAAGLLMIGGVITKINALNREKLNSDIDDLPLKNRDEQLNSDLDDLRSAEELLQELEREQYIKGKNRAKLNITLRNADELLKEVERELERSDVKVQNRAKLNLGLEHK